MITEHHCPECASPLPQDGCVGLCPRCVAATLAASMPFLKPHAETPVVPGWILERHLGTGGQGSVWFGIRELDEEPAAVKIFRSTSAADLAEDAVRLDTEVAVLKKLDHPNIVRILDSGILSNGQAFLATEYIEGCDLLRLVRARRVTPQESIEIAIQLASTLSHAHKNGVVHRDLKPANVIVASDGRVKLVDFSLARQTQASLLTQATADGTTFGTPYYLAPERLHGAPGSAAADMYSLGVLLYEILTSSLPMGRFLSAAEKSGLPKQVDTLINSLLSENPTLRPSAEDAERQLRQLAQKLASTTHAAGTRKKVRMATGVACVAALAGGIGFLARPVATPSASMLDAPVSPNNAAGFARPELASMAQPWKNSLQMAFLPVPGLPNLLFSKYETRQSDWASYQQQSETEEGILWQNEFGARVKSRVPMRTLTAAGWVDVPNTSQTTVPYFPTEPESAACGINHFMAQRFCSWLTWKEQRQGRIGPGEYYRLPTDAEWSQAADLPPERGLTPKERHENLASTEHRYPWGPEWPPPVNFANYAGKEARDAEWPETWNSLKLRKDEFPRTAPVGRFAANRHGLHDLWGNVWEWCSDALSPSAGTLVLRGASWVDGGYDVQLRRDFRNAHPAAFRDSTTGFRCVLVLRKPDGK